jgi:AcrR family transcriptional regulator
VERPNRRAEQARQTRSEILDAARRRFAEVGYAATTIREVAAEAGVSVQTVYDSVGSKAELVRGLNDRIDEEARVHEVMAGLDGAAAAELVAVPAAITRRLVERCGDIVRVVLAGQHQALELATVAEEGFRRHRAGTEGVVRRLAATGALREDLSLGQATDTVAALADFRLALLLVDDYGMDAAQVEAWTVMTTARAVLAPGAAGTG